MKNIHLISLIISVSSFLLPLLLGYKKRRTLLWIYIFTGFAFDILLMILKRVFHFNLFPIANLYVLIEFLILSFYYYKATGKEYKYFIHTIAILTILYTTQTFLHGIEKRNGVGAATLYAIYLLYALWGFFVISKRHLYDIVTQSSFFWVNVAILLSSSGRVILFLFEDYLTLHQHGHLATLWVIYRMFNVLINILFAIALTRRYE